jgi:predicted small lipoprotein YifL
MRYTTLILLLVMALSLVAVLSACGGKGGGGY